MVRKQEKVVRDVLPHYFKQSKLISFHRKLNLYGFTRILGPGPDKGGYYHEKCLLGRSHLFTHIMRITTKGPRPSHSYDPDTESNFYSMKPVPKDNSTTASGERQKRNLMKNSFVNANWYTCGERVAWEHGSRWEDGTAKQGTVRGQQSVHGSVQEGPG